MPLPRNARGVLNSLFRHKWRFLGVFAAVLALAVAVALMVKPAYRSDALLLVKFAGRTPAMADVVAGAAIQAQSTERREVMNSQAQILRSHDLLREVVTSTGIARLYPELAADPPDDGSLEDKAAQAFAKDLTVEPTKEATILQVSLRNQDAAAAAAGLGLLIDRFRSRQADAYLNPQSTFLEEQLKVARDQLGRSQAAVERFKSEAGISSLDEERTLLLRLRAEARNNLAQQSARRSEAESRAEQLAASLRELKPTIQLSDENDRFKGIDDARSRLTELRARESEMKSNYLDDSVALKSLRAQIEFAERDLAERSKESLARVRTGPNPVFQQVQSDLMRATAEAAAAAAAMDPLEGQVAQVEDRLGRLDAGQARLQDLLLQQQVDEENFRSVLQRLEDARAAEELQRQNVSSVVVVQQPTVPSEHSGPRRLLIVALGAMAGLGLAFAVCLLWELADERFSLPEQVSGTLNLPVLATFGDAPHLRNQGAR